MRRTLRALGLIVLCGVAAVAAQPRSTGWGRQELPYDGRLTFVRLRWTSGTYGARVMGQGPNFWLHEFPRAEQNLMTVLDLAEYWQMAGTGFFPIESENIGFRLGVNYMLYGMTH